MEEQATSGVGGNVAGGFGAGEYAEFMRLKAELKQRRVEDRVKSLGNNKVVWRQRLALRRIDIKELAPDADLVAYDAIHKLKNPNADSKQKVTISDNEIAAYKELDPDFNKMVSLAEVLAQVTHMKNAGELTAAGDNTGNGEEVVEE